MRHAKDGGRESSASVRQAAGQSSRQQTTQDVAHCARAAAGRRSLSILGYQFKVLDGLITNFHLPESTLLMLVSALAGKDAVLKAYKEAVECRYRFFSIRGCDVYNLTQNITFVN